MEEPGAPARRLAGPRTDPLGSREAALARELARQLATLSLCQVAADGPAQAALAVGCRNVLARLGFDVPLCVVADLHTLLTSPPGERRPPDAGEAPAVREGRPAGGTGQRRAGELAGRLFGLWRALAEVPAVVAVARRSLGVEVLAVLIARLLSEVGRAESGGAPAEGAREPTGALPFDLPLAGAAYGVAPAVLARQHDPGWVLPFWARLVQARELVLARAEQLDAGPLRLLGMFPGGAAAELLALYELFSSPLAGRAVELSLQLLPSVLETRRAASAQQLAIDGYASIERRGSLDALLPSELAHDAEVFRYKALAEELLHYGHARHEDHSLREHWIVIDASASMLGAREVFARGLGLALAKRLHLQGETVALRFFDARLHRRVNLAHATAQELPYLYCFRAGRGRHPSRAFEELLVEARRVRTQGGRALAITFLTHAECHVPVATMAALAQQATLSGLFILPSRPLALAYLDTLHHHAVVHAEDLAEPSRRKRRALEFVDRVAARAG